MNDDCKLDNVFLTIRKDTIIYAPSIMLQFFFAFFAFWVYTHILTTFEYGEYIILINAYALFGVFIYSWINSSILRYYPKYEKDLKLNELYSTIFFALIFLFCLSVVTMYFLLKYLYIDYYKYIYIVAGLVISTSIFEIIMTLLRIQRQSKHVLIFRTLNVSICPIIIVLASHLAKVNIVFIFISIIFINFLISGLILMKHDYLRHISFTSISIAILRDFINFGIPLIPVTFFSWVLVSSDRYVLGLFRGNSEVGIYSATYQLAWFPLSLISSILIMGVLPIIFDTWEKQGIVRTKELLSGITRYYLILATPTLFILTILSKDLMNIIGSSYGFGASFVPWITIAAFAAGINNFTCLGCELKGKTTTLSITIGMAAILNVLINLVLIPSYGMYGASISTAISYVIYLIFTGKASWNLLPWDFPFRTFSKSIFASILMLLIIILIKAFLPGSHAVSANVLLLIIGYVIYIISMYYLGELTYEVNFIMATCKHIIVSQTTKPKNK